MPHPSTAAAIEDHYRPLGPNDRVPTDPVAVALALADKLDSLVGFWSINEKPTGSGDPYGSRRAALGVVRILLTHGIRLKPPSQDLLVFLADRLKVQLREQGKRHDLVDAVFALGDDDLVRIVARVEALSDFLKTDDGKNLLAGYKRAANILAAEEKKDAGLPERLGQTAIDASLFAEPAEKALHAALTAAQEAAAQAMLQERFADAMKALASLRTPVDAMLDGVLVNAADPALRLNRLLLLAGIRASLNAVADFSKIEG